MDCWRTLLTLFEIESKVPELKLKLFRVQASACITHRNTQPEGFTLNACATLDLGLTHLHSKYCDPLAVFS